MISTTAVTTTAIVVTGGGMATGVFVETTSGDIIHVTRPDRDRVESGRDDSNRVDRGSVERCVSGDRRGLLMDEFVSNLVIFMVVLLDILIVLVHGIYSYRLSEGKC